MTIATWENAEAGDTIGQPKKAANLYAELMDQELFGLQQAIELIGDNPQDTELVIRQIAVAKRQCRACFVRLAAMKR